MLMAELSTAVLHRLPVKVLNNGALRQALWEQRTMGWPNYGCALGTVDFAAAARRFALVLGMVVGSGACLGMAGCGPMPSGTEQPVLIEHGASPATPDYRGLGGMGDPGGDPGANAGMGVGGGIQAGGGPALP